MILPGRRFRKCGDCGHFFDGRDDRGFVPPASASLPPACPACNIVSRAAEAWALVNECQGVFVDAVFHSRGDARAAIVLGIHDDAAPVRVIREPAEGIWLRHAKAAEDERPQKVSLCVVK